MNWVHRDIDAEWSYVLACHAVPAIQRKLEAVRPLAIQAGMLYSRCTRLAIEHDPLPQSPRKNALAVQWKELDERYRRTCHQLNKTIHEIMDMGVYVHELIHGIVLFPFFHPDNQEPCFFLYREGEGAIESWITLDQAQKDSENESRVSIFTTGIFNSIPEDWN